MNTLELLDKKELLKKRAEEIISGAEKEVRKLNAGEQVEFDTLTKEVADIDIQIRKIEEDNLKQTTHTTNTMKEKFSLLKAINDVANNRQLDERAQEVVTAGISEMRKAGQSYSGQIVLPIEERANIQATVATAGQENVAEDKLGILEPLRASLVLAQAGASYMTGLVGNVSIPVYSGSNVGWAGEVTAAIAKGVEAAKKNLTRVPVLKGTVPHEQTAKFGGAEVFIKPASTGTGVVAGGAMRAVLESVGITDVLAKSKGSSNPHNLVKATIQALSEMRDARTVAQNRGVSMEKVFRG